MLSQIDHINIVVRDLARMTEFYRDVLGLSVTLLPGPAAVVLRGKVVKFK